MHDADLHYAIGLTGGIATGKSSVCSLLRLSGFIIIDADTIAHECLDAHTKEICDLFGLSLQSGKIDRKALGAIIFANPAKRKELEHFLHPLIREQIMARCEVEERKAKPYIVDVPLLFETGAYRFKKTILVYAPHTTQLARLIQREGLTETQAQLRLDAQLPIEEKKGKTTYLIENAYNLKHLQQEVEHTIQRIKSDFQIK